MHTSKPPSLIRLFGILTALSLISGCSSMKIEDFKGQKPQLILEEYFLGNTTAWGIFEDRFGKLKRSFKVQIDGKIIDGVLILKEDFVYTDGETSQRIWHITPEGNGRYTGRADDVIGVAQGRVVGNALNWRYDLNLPVGDSVWRVSFNDWLFLQSDGVLINKAQVSKWGFHLGTVTLFFQSNKPNN